MGTVIAFANQKGGVGKSTLTVQAAFYFATKEKKKVLVVDIDSQGNTTESLTQGQPYEGTSSAGVPCQVDIKLTRITLYQPSQWLTCNSSN